MSQVRATIFAKLSLKYDYHLIKIKQSTDTLIIMKKASFGSVSNLKKNTFNFLTISIMRNIIIQDNYTYNESIEQAE